MKKRLGIAFFLSGIAFLVFVFIPFPGKTQTNDSIGHQYVFSIKPGPEKY